MKTNKVVFLLGSLFLLSMCGAVFAGGTKEKGKSLDAAIEEAAINIESKLEEGTKIAALNFSSASGGLSEYVLEEISGYLVNGEKLLVVDRSDLDSIRAELDFNLSGEVDDKSAQEAGRILGAQYIVSGSFQDMGDVSRIRFKTIAVASAGIAASYSGDVINDRKIERLLATGGTGGGSPAVAQGRAGTQGSASGSANSGGGSNAAAPAAPAAPPAPVYKVGDTGPASGLVFYDKGNNSGGWRYLEAAPANTEKTAVYFAHRFISNHLDKGDYEFIFNKGVRDAGYGKRNTAIIVKAATAAAEWDTAAQVCDELHVNGFDDWFLPSLIELSFMYGNLARKGLGGFAEDKYWSSTGRLDTNTYYIDFKTGNSTGDQGNTSKALVRAVRQF
jgi:TolB-like protein